MGELWRKLRRFSRRGQLADRLREELEFHEEMSGASPGRRTVILEQADDVWSLGWWEHAWSDLRYAVRVLGRSPAFFALATAGAALGIAAITAVVSVGDSVLVRSLPYRHPGELVVGSDQVQ